MAGPVSTMTPEQVEAWEREQRARIEEPSCFELMEPGRAYPVSKLAALWRCSGQSAQAGAEELLLLGLVELAPIGRLGGIRAYVRKPEAGGRYVPSPEAETDRIYEERYGSRLRKVARVREAVEVAPKAVCAGCGQGFDPDAREVPLGSIERVTEQVGGDAATFCKPSCAFRASPPITRAR